ncbi:BspA family leucine-rich repeat surface protein [Mycoplasma capricolum subsp. capricolum]|uniref:BspA family leucine-rich repeat surface protein n=1 Tax=Mycoplasma capricolum TaxID=2095 RepID=UPI003DA59889
MFKQAVYDDDLTECLEIGYFENWKGEIQIEQFKPTTKKVPKTLPKEITSLAQAFKGNENESIDGIQYWDTSNVTNMSRMFWEATSFNQPIGNWDTSNVTNMEYMFYEAKNFNQSIGNWNTSNVTNMAGMFFGDKNFNHPIGSWNTSNVFDMSFMFKGATKFNQDISMWKTSKVKNMSFMFFGASSFNQDLSKWDTSSVGELWQDIDVSNPNWKPEHWPQFNN